MTLIRRIFDTKATPTLVVVGLLLFVAESKWKLRKRTQKQLKRVVTNSAVSVPALSLLRLLLLPAMVRVATKNRQSRSGLNYLYIAPPLVKTVVAFLLLDYTNYLWHVLMHRVSLLWRFHLVHHTDLDMDVTTAFRFHFGEMVGSTFYRGAAVFLIGASPVNVLVYEALFEAATQFHHSNTKLPYRLEKVLSKLVVTPRMHGIHHSMVRRQTDSNYSVIFSLWDRLHCTLRLNVPQDLVVIGVPAYSDPGELTINFLWRMPFSPVRPWPAESSAFFGTGSSPENWQLAR